jgi:hypothetical protein
MSESMVELRCHPLVTSKKPFSFLISPRENKRIRKYIVRNMSADEERRKAEKPVVTIKDAVDLLEKYWGYEQSSFTQVK